jgi:hypothetical protein
MAFTIEQLPGEPIWIITYEEPIDFKNDPVGVKSYLGEATADCPGVFYSVHDARDITVKFSDVVMGLAAAFRTSNFKLDASRGRMLVVGAEKLIRLAAESAKQVQYGGVHIEIFDTMEEALAYAREQLAAGGG